MWCVCLQAGVEKILQLKCLAEYKDRCARGQSPLGSRAPCAPRAVCLATENFKPDFASIGLHMYSPPHMTHVSSSSPDFASIGLMTRMMRPAQKLPGEEAHVSSSSPVLRVPNLCRFPVCSTERDLLHCQKRPTTVSKETSISCVQHLVFICSIFLETINRLTSVAGMYAPPHMTHVSSSSYDACILVLSSSRLSTDLHRWQVCMLLLI